MVCVFMMNFLVVLRPVSGVAQEVSPPAQQTPTNANAAPAQAGQVPAAENNEWLDVPLAVLVFKEDENLKGVGAQTSDLLQVYMAENMKLSFVDRASINHAFSEMELGLSGTIDPATAAKIGHMVGAKVIVTGSVFTMGSEITFMAKIVGVETGQVFAEAVTQSLKEPKEEGIRKLAAKLTDTLSLRGKNLLAKPTQEDDTMERYATALQGKQLPTVSIDIEETHVNHDVIDPAAESEVGFMLQSLGFPLQDKKVTKKAVDIEITGAAFSEYAGRVGNLISCKARVEIKAVNPKTGKILAMDRETDVAVELSENVAGKLAIQKATKKIMNRIIPKLAP